MAYNEPVGPDPTYTVVVQVQEVIGAYSTGQGTSAVRHERKVTEALSLTVRGDDEKEAVERALTMLAVHKEGL